MRGTYLTVVSWLIYVVVVIVAKLGVAGVCTATRTLRRWPGWSRQLWSVCFRRSSCLDLFAVLASVTGRVRRGHTRVLGTLHHKRDSSQMHRSINSVPITVSLLSIRWIRLLDLCWRISEVSKYWQQQEPPTVHKLFIRNSRGS
jgi:hypothetical protein